MVERVSTMARGRRVANISDTFLWGIGCHSPRCFRLLTIGKPFKLFVMTDQLAAPELDDYQSLRRKYDVLRRAFVVLGCFLLIFFDLVVSRIVLMIPRFEKIFAEMLNGESLPQLTRLVIQFSRGGGMGSLVALAATTIPTILAMFCILKYRESVISWIITIAVIAYLLFLTVVIPFALYLPMLKIISEMNRIVHWSFL